MESLAKAQNITRSYAALEQRLLAITRHIEGSNPQLLTVKQVELAYITSCSIAGNYLDLK